MNTLAQIRERLAGADGGRVAVAVSAAADVCPGANSLSAGVVGLDVAVAVKAVSGVGVPPAPAQATTARATRLRMTADGPLIGRPLVAAGSGDLLQAPLPSRATRGHGSAEPPRSCEGAIEVPVAGTLSPPTTRMGRGRHRTRTPREHRLPMACKLVCDLWLKPSRGRRTPASTVRHLEPNSPRPRYA